MCNKTPDSFRRSRSGTFGDDEEDEFGEDDSVFDEDEFDGSYTYDNE